MILAEVSDEKPHSEHPLIMVHLEPTAMLNATSFILGAIHVIHGEGL
jgi:hypothetical protein